MSRRRRDVSPDTTQDQPTQPPARDAQGFELDEWGLPVTGPARIAALERLGRPDPIIDPEGWAAPDVDPTPAPLPEEPVTENHDVD